MTENDEFEINIYTIKILKKKSLKTEDGAVKINFLDHKNMINKKIYKDVTSDLIRSFEDKKNNMYKAFPTKITIQKRKNHAVKCQKIQNHTIRRSVKTEKNETSKNTITDNY